MNIVANDLKIVLFVRIENFSTLEKASEISNDFISHIPNPTELLIKLESSFYKEEPIDHPYFTIEAQYYNFITHQEAFALLNQLNTLEMKSICNQFTLTLKNYK